MSLDSQSMDRYLKKNGIKLPKELERIRNMTMGDVVLENLQRQLGDDLKLSGSGEKLKEKKKAARKVKKASDEQKQGGATKNAIPLPEPSFENISSVGKETSAKKTRKPGTLSAAEFAKLQKAYTKYKQDNTPHSFGGASTIARSTDYSKWDKYASELDDEDTAAVLNGKGTEESASSMDYSPEISEEQNRFWVKIITCVLSFFLSLTSAFIFGIESTFIKQAMFGIFAVFIFNYLQPTGSKLTDQFSASKKKEL